MKITDHSDEMLIVDGKPWVAGIVFGSFGLLIGALGFFMLFELVLGGVFLLLVSAAIFTGFYFLIERTQIVFYRPDGTVESRKRSLRRYDRKTYLLSEIESAVVLENVSTNSNGGSSKTSQINLIRTNGQGILPFTTSYASGKQYQGIADTINGWLSADRVQD